VNNGKGEGSGLAGSRLRNAEQIGAGEDARDGLGLNRSGRALTFLAERLQDGSGKTEF
jgi:hypothetical protein